MTTTDKRVVLVAAVASNGVIGADGAMPWDLPEDLVHFRNVTQGNTVVMGRRTFESIGRPLPKRTNIVITRQPDWTADGVTVVHSFEEALAAAQAHEGNVMVVGGAQVYAAAMARADLQVLTEVRLRPDGDTFYPPYDPAEWSELRREPHETFDFVWLARAGRVPADR